MDSSPRTTARSAAADEQRLTLAELLAMMAVIALAAAITATYLLDRLGLGVRPWIGAGSAIAAPIVALVRRRGDLRWRLDETLAFLLIGGATLASLLWLAWPMLLPLGSGSDLTHHLILVDYIERHGQLPHDASAVEYLGEMAHYTPGLHLLAVIAGTIARTDGFHALYPVVAFAVALKYAIFFLVLLRLLADSPIRLPLSVAGTIAVLTASTYTLGSFVEDSFLAQAVGELFAVAGWWALVWWEENLSEAAPQTAEKNRMVRLRLARAVSSCPPPAGESLEGPEEQLDSFVGTVALQDSSRTAMSLFAVAGTAIFLTWPIWIGPPAVALALLLLWPRKLAAPATAAHALIALVPIAIVALVHTIGRAGQVAIVGTSGAVVPPSVAVLGWPLPLVSVCGAIVATVRRRQRAALAFAIAIAAQAAGLWLVASGRTPYMAIKMTYLAIYPAIAFAMVFVDAAWHTVSSHVHALSARRPSLALAWVAVLALALATRREIPVRSKVQPVVSNEMFAAGVWARTHVPAGCVDYLVGNEYTAYWLHLAVLGNPRISSRTGDDKTFLTQPSMARWLVPGAPRYAIANLAILPAEIRGDVNVLQQFGQAAVIERRAASGCETR